VSLSGATRAKPAEKATMSETTSKGWHEAWNGQRESLTLRVFHLAAQSEPEKEDPPQQGPLASQSHLLEIEGAAGQSVLLKPSQVGGLLDLLDKLRHSILRDARLRDGDWQ
jgi:hypothetical protein